MPPQSSESTFGFKVLDCPIVMDRYQIVGVLGKGGMGKVYKAFHTKLKRDVALKTLRVDNKQDAGLIERFLREMETIGKVDHLNVVRATDAGESNGILMLVMEYLSGEDLSKIVVRHGRLKPADACELIRQAAEGLEHIHRTLIHRDIKPSNLQLTESGVVKILDLGLARFQSNSSESEITPSGCIVGSFEYLAPEQALGEGNVDKRADIYSLGCTLFRLLVGRAPFTGPKYDSPPKKIMAHTQIPMQDAEGFLSIPRELQAIILRMTAKKPADRYATATLVAKALTPHCKGHKLAALLNSDRELNSLTELTSEHVEELKLLGVGGQSQIETPHTRAEAITHGTVTVSRRFAWLLGTLSTLAVAIMAIILVGGAKLWRNDTPVTGNKTETTQTNPKTIAMNVPTEPRDLDGLKSGTDHELLGQMPFPIPNIAPGAKNWHWELKLLEAKSEKSMIFHLGTSTKKQFTIDARMNQTPLTGEAGLVWGYREHQNVIDPVKDPFASFEYLLLDVRTMPKGKDAGVEKFSIHRCRGQLLRTKDGQVTIKKSEVTRQDLPAQLNGPKLWVIDIDGNQLVGATFQTIPLTSLLIAEKQEPTLKPDYQESTKYGIGLVSMGHNVSFDRVSIKYPE